MRIGNFAGITAMLAGLAAAAKRDDTQRTPMQSEPSLSDLKGALAALDVPGISYPGQMKHYRMLRDGYRDVYNPHWRAWAKLRPLAS